MTDINYHDVIEREIVMTRVINAPRERVFDAWTTPEKIQAWFGPAGWHCETRSIDLREGGRWCFDMVSPDGERFSNRMTFVEVTRPSRLIFDHGEDIDNDTNQFHVTVTFDARSDDVTVLSMRQLHPSAMARARVMSFGGVELGYQTLDKLAASVE